MNGMSSKAGRKPSWYAVRPGFLLGVGLLVVLGLASCLHYRGKEGSGVAGGTVPVEAFREPWREGKVLLVGMGDSVVTGFGAGPGRGFFDLLARRTSGDDPALVRCDLQSVYPALSVLNLAENSSNSEEHLRIQLKRLPVQSPDVHGIVIVSTGGIDLIHDYGAGTPRDGALYGADMTLGNQAALRFGERLGALLDGLASRFPGGCHVYLMTIYDPTDGVGDIENAGALLRLIKPLPAWPEGLAIHAAFNEQIRKVASSRPWARVVDVHGLMLGHGLHCSDKANPHYDAKDPHYWYYLNLEDPNERGYDAIRRAFLRALASDRPGRRGT